MGKASWPWIGQRFLGYAQITSNDNKKKDKVNFIKIKSFVYESAFSLECKVTQPCLTLYDPMDRIAHQAPLSMEFFRQEYCSGLPFPFPGDLPNPGIEPGSPASQADALPSEPTGKPYQITNGIFHRTRTKNFTIYIETQKIPNSQSKLEKEKWS